MEVRVSLGGAERVVTSEGFLASCGRASVEVKTNAWGRVVLRGRGRVVEQARGLLRASQELEAAVLVELAEGNPSLAELMDERAGILGADGLPDGPFDAALSLIGPEWPEDEIEEETK